MKILPISTNLTGPEWELPTVHLLEMQGWVEKNFSDVLDLHINRSVSLSAFHCTFSFLQQSSYRIFITKSLISTVSVNPYGGLK